MQSVLNSAVSTVTRSQGNLLGEGKLDVSSALSGAVQLIDTEVELEVCVDSESGNPSCPCYSWLVQTAHEASPY